MNNLPVSGWMLRDWCGGGNLNPVIAPFIRIRKSAFYSILKRCGELSTPFSPLSLFLSLSLVFALSFHPASPFSAEIHCSSPCPLCNFSQKRFITIPHTTHGKLFRRTIFKFQRTKYLHYCCRERALPLCPGTKYLFIYPRFVACAHRHSTEPHTDLERIRPNNRWIYFQAKITIWRLH